MPRIPALPTFWSLPRAILALLTHFCYWEKISFTAVPARIRFSNTLRSTNCTIVETASRSLHPSYSVQPTPRTVLQPQSPHRRGTRQGALGRDAQPCPPEGGTKYNNRSIPNHPRLKPLIPAAELQISNSPPKLPST
jgi:hypothetical protein